MVQEQDAIFRRGELKIRNRLVLIGEDDKIFNLHLLMAFNFILNLAGRISLSVLTFKAHLHKRDFIMMYWAKIQSNCNMLGIKEMPNE
ncbi:hypothetical protein T03_1673 [Trichinella britovi]|uniref:Uncharacterized protein n=1 Tax=Trichinella britovi TaxID=45882 RepID=A0A0V1DAB3_TRIBR|nr:hypothetical protein T03_1673 [Trichinella britovi]